MYTIIAIITILGLDGIIRIIQMVSKKLWNDNSGLFRLFWLLLAFRLLWLFKLVLAIIGIIEENFNDCNARNNCNNSNNPKNRTTSSCTVASIVLEKGHVCKERTSCVLWYVGLVRHICNNDLMSKLFLNIPDLILTFTFSNQLGSKLIQTVRCHHLQTSCRKRM